MGGICNLFFVLYDRQYIVMGAFINLGSRACSVSFAENKAAFFQRNRFVGGFCNTGVDCIFRGAEDAAGFGFLWNCNWYSDSVMFSFGMLFNRKTA